MDTFVDSSWYFLRYTSPRYTAGPFDPAKAEAWCPVDQYTGGAEHAVMHLLYARFFTKALRDLGLVKFNEPFLRLYNQGTIIAQRHKMSKSRGNVITPDPYVKDLGADVVRIYLMFLGPWDQGGEWSDQGINGMARWMNRVWDLALRDPSQLDRMPTDSSAVRELQRALHKTIKKAVTDLAGFHFNTALATMMEFTNALGRAWEEQKVDTSTWRECIKKLILLLTPVAPHVAEELWERTGHPYSVHNQRLPQWDELLAADEVVTLVVQVNGRVRDRIQVPADIPEEQAKELALRSSNAQRHMNGRPVAKLVYVPRRLVNIVVQD